MSNTRLFKLYIISTIPSDKAEYIQMAEESAKGGADVFQLRVKNLPDKEFLAQAKKVKAICARYNVLFIINDRVDITLACQADGVHLGQDDMPLQTAREILGKDKIIGCSTHSLEQALKAEEEGADYIGVGPIFSTPTKPDYKEVGVELIEKVSKKINIPFVAIGGINLDNLESCLNAGARAVAVVRAVSGSNDIKKNAELFKERIDKHRHSGICV
ncbi:MAG: thiamine phosphate synthase [bacterium]